MSKKAGRTLKIRVPASTSNLGPGFDALGLALDLWNEVELEVSAGKDEVVVELEGEGEKTLAKGKDNLVAKAALAVLAGKPTGRLVFRCKNRIPLARGLGSSAAATVAGLLAGNRLVDKPLEPRALLEYAATFEGHLDNVAPALHAKGGLVACVRRHKDFDIYPLEVHPELAAAVCIPAFELETKKARAVLPKTYLREQAVDNVARVAVLAQALREGRWERLPRAMEDFLHQPYRAPLVPGLSTVVSAANDVEGCGAALSGSGPSVLALGRRGANLEKAAAAMKSAFAAAGVQSTTRVLEIAREGASVAA